MPWYVQVLAIHKQNLTFDIGTWAAGKSSLNLFDFYQTDYDLI